MLILTGGTAIALAQTNIERKQLFNNNWKFILGDIPNASNSNFDDNGWRTLDLPHDWSIEGTLDQNNPTGNDGGYFPAGIGWYRKTFTVPVTWKDKHVSIYFEGVYMNSEVFINGKSLGVYPYGYSSFSYDLTPYLKLNGKMSFLFGLIIQSKKIVVSIAVRAFTDMFGWLLPTPYTLRNGA
jgi:beta-galactosidase/beta-glucuronidase